MVLDGGKGVGGGRGVGWGGKGVVAGFKRWQEGAGRGGAVGWGGCR